MKNALLIAALFVCFNSFGQSYLGETKNDLIKICLDKYNLSEISVDRANDKYAIIKIQAKDETVYLHLLDDVCTEVIVSKNDIDINLASDRAKWSSDYISIGIDTWISKDLNTVYRLTIRQESYNLSSTINEEEYSVTAKIN